NLARATVEDARPVVSILVLLDLSPQPARPLMVPPHWQGFNPCSSGSQSSTTSVFFLREALFFVSILVLLHLSPQLSSAVVMSTRPTRCFNPCSSGSQSSTHFPGR